MAMAMARPGERWIEASEVIPMFPTLLWKIRLEPQLREGIDAKILGARSAQARPAQARAKDQHQLQPHVFLVHGKPEQAALVMWRA